MALFGSIKSALESNAAFLRKEGGFLANVAYTINRTLADLIPDITDESTTDHFKIVENNKGIPFRGLALPAMFLSNLSCQAIVGDEEGWLSGGSDSGPPPKSEPVIPETTKVLEEERWGELISIAEDQSVLNFRSDSSYAQDLSQGDVIVSDVQDAAPEGLLRKVTGVTQEGDQIVVHTEAATLEDAIEEGTLEISYEASEDRETVDQPLRWENLETQSFPLEASVDRTYHVDLEETEITDGITVAGSFEAGIRTYLRIDIKARGIQYFKLERSLNDKLNLEGTIRREVEFDDGLSFNPFSFRAIRAKIGKVPVVVKPEITIKPYAKVDGTFTAHAAVHQEGSVSYSIEYNKDRENRWKVDIDPNFEFGYEEPTFSGCGEVKVGLEGIIGLKFFGALGLYGGVDGYLREVAADKLTLLGGVNLFAEVNAKVFGATLLETGHLKLYEYEKQLWEGESPCVQEENGEEPVESPWIFQERIVLPKAVIRGEETIVQAESLAWDGSKLWYLAILNLNGEGRIDLCSFNIQTDQRDFCIEGIEERDEHISSTSIAFANDQMYYLQHDAYSGYRNRLYSVNLEDGSKEFIADLSVDLPHDDDYNKSKLYRVSSYNNMLVGFRQSAADGTADFCTLLLPNHLDCPERRHSPFLKDLIKIGEEEYFGLTSSKLFTIRGSFQDGIAQDVDLMTAERCGIGGHSLAKVGDKLFVGCILYLLRYTLE